MKLYMFRTLHLSINMSLCTVHSAMVFVIQVCRQLSSRTFSKAVYKPVWHIQFLSVRWINSCWWPGEMSETCRYSWQNRFVKLVNVVGFITKEYLEENVWRNCSQNSFPFVRNYHTTNTLQIKFLEATFHVFNSLRI